MIECQHAIAKGNRLPRWVSWWWCEVRAVQITPEKHCSEECHSLKAGKGEQDMPGIKGIGWDRPASETVEGAPEELQLWAWAQEQLESGGYGALARTARAIECDSNSLKSAISVRSQAKPAARPPLGEPEAGSPGSTTGKRDASSRRPTAEQRGKIDWDRPAGETVEGASEELQLWAWAEHEIRNGERGTLGRIAAEIGCAGVSLKAAIKVRTRRETQVSSGIGWDAPASETVEGAPGDVPLWKWAVARMQAGPRGAKIEVAHEIGCSVNGLNSAIRRRQKPSAATRPAGSALGEGDEAPSPGATPGRVEGARPTVQQREELERRRAAGLPPTVQQRRELLAGPPVDPGGEGEAEGGSDVAHAIAPEGIKGPPFVDEVDEMLAAGCADQLLLVPQEALVEFLRIEGMGHDAACFSAGWIAHLQAQAPCRCGMSEAARTRQAGPRDASSPRSTA